MSDRILSSNADESQAVAQALALVRRVIAEGFTGHLNLRFKGGVPQAAERTEYARFGPEERKAKRGRHLTDEP